MQLTRRQKEALAELRNIFGDISSETCNVDDAFIENLVERGQDSRNVFRPSVECLLAVERILPAHQVGDRVSLPSWAKLRYKVQSRHGVIIEIAHGAGHIAITRVLKNGKPSTSQRMTIYLGIENSHFLQRQ